MAKRVIRGYWDCPHCNTKGIDGLLDKCPNCGGGKAPDTKYYMKGTNVVTDQELEKAKIGKDENDGKHKEWVCEYCGQLNNYSDTTCAYCGSPKEDAKREYGDTKPKETPVINQPVNKSSILPKLLPILLVILVVLFFPLSKKQTVTALQYESKVYVEESYISHESDWSLPSGATETSQKSEIYGYDQVFDHYETQYVQRSRSVVSGYEEECSYNDNGNGTFTEECHSVPVYETEYYTDTEQVAIYRNEPIYQIKYYYDIERWMDVDTYEYSGSGKQIQYPTGYLLADGQRDTSRDITYYIVLDQTKTVIVDESTYMSHEVGDVIKQTRNLLGMVYSEEVIGNE